MAAVPTAFPYAALASALAAPAASVPAFGAPVAVQDAASINAAPAPAGGGVPIFPTFSYPKYNSEEGSEEDSEEGSEEDSEEDSDDYNPKKKARF